MHKINNRTAKIKASKKAIAFLKKRIRKSTIIGIGSGTTMTIFIRLLGKAKLKAKVRAIPSSLQIEKEIRKAGIQIVRNTKPAIAIDGADQITARGILKGYSAFAFTIEKRIDYSAKEVIFIVDKSKFSKKFTLPVLIEIKKASQGKVSSELARLNFSIIKKIKHNNNLILFLSYKKQFNPIRLEKKINSLPGVIDNGIFIFKKRPVIITD